MTPVINPASREAKYRQRQKQKLLNELFPLKDGPYPIGGELGN
jgi:hypothetical protein